MALCKPRQKHTVFVFLIIARSDDQLPERSSYSLWEYVYVMEKVRIDRLSELTRISRARELTADEKKEREELRNEYRQSVVGDLRNQLEHTTIIRPDGTHIKVSDMKNHGEDR